VRETRIKEKQKVEKIVKERKREKQKEK